MPTLLRLPLHHQLQIVTGNVEKGLHDRVPSSGFSCSHQTFREGKQPKRPPHQAMLRMLAKSEVPCSGDFSAQKQGGHLCPPCAIYEFSFADRVYVTTVNDHPLSSPAASMAITLQ